jgi:hypothetical protein
MGENDDEASENQNMVNLIVGFPIWRCSRIFMKLRCGNIVLLAMTFLEVA